MARRVGIRVSFTALKTNFRPVPTALLLSRLDKYTKEYMQELMEWVRVYPPSRFGKAMPGESGAVRERTYELLNSWLVKRTSRGDGISYSLENWARERDRPRGKYYARIVHGPGVGSPRGQGTNPDMAGFGWRNIDNAIEEIGTREEFRANAQFIINKVLGV